MAARRSHSPPTAVGSRCQNGSLYWNAFVQGCHGPAPGGGWCCGRDTMRTRARASAWWSQTKIDFTLSSQRQTPSHEGEKARPSSSRLCELLLWTRPFTSQPARALPNTARGPRGCRKQHHVPTDPTHHTSAFHSPPFSTEQPAMSSQAARSFGGR